MEDLYNVVLNSDQTVTTVLREENQAVSDSEWLGLWYRDMFYGLDGV